MTIKELITRLKQYADDSPIVIVDADTGWYLHVLDVDSALVKNERVVILSGDYSHELEEKE